MANKHSISLAQAVDMTTRYRANQPENCPISETFDRAAVQSLLDNTACASMRIYYGMKEDMSVHAILVAADAEGHDLLPSAGGDFSKDFSNDFANGEGDHENEILEDGIRCPVDCPPPSPLNP